MFIFSGKPKLKVLFVASEAAPFAKAGGLGEIMFSLPRAVRKLGHSARVMVPRYAGIDQDKYKLTMELEQLSVPTDAQELNQPTHLICNVKKYKSDPKDPRSPVTTYFLENQEYYEARANVYGYADDAVRWALLSRGVLEFLRVTRKQPDIIVAADWQAGFLLNYLKTVYKDDKYLSSIATVFSIHNLSHQAMFDHHFISEMDYDAGQSALPSFYDPRILKLNIMRRGIMNADVINTVSPTYAKEILTPEYGELLDTLLRERRSVLYGILNGIDYETVNPKTDSHLAAQYDARGLDKRIQNKIQLQERFGLPKDPNKFMVGIVSRLDGQKGFNLLFETLEPMLKQLDMQLAVVGSGDAGFMGFFNEMSKKYPEQVAAHLSFDEVLPHLIFGGADALLIPSRFEPSGLTQMEAMRYGTVPIVRKTGGLADTVDDYNPVDNTGTGFVFDEFSNLALIMAMTRAYENYRNKEVWRGIQRRAMEKDFSWEHSAQEYIKLFDATLEIKKRALGGKE